MAVMVPTLAACLCWDYGMRRGDVVLLGSVSLCIPLISSLISSFYLRADGPALLDRVPARLRGRGGLPALGA